MERIYKDKSAKLDDGDGGDPPKDGGDERPEGDDGEGDSRRLTSAEKYGIKGMFAKECLLFNLSTGDLARLKESPTLELKEIQRVRQILENELACFLPSYDLETRKIHFYCKINTIKEKL